MASKGLVILSFNEIEGSKAVFDKIPFEIFDQVLVVDGGSTDGTIEFWRKHGYKVVKQDIPGRGSGFVLANNLLDTEILLFFSPDGNENPGDIPKLLEAVESGADFAVASRFGKGGSSDDAGFIRTLGNKMFTLAIRLFFGIKTTDAVNGFRAIWKEKFNKLKLPNSKFEIEFQMTVRAGKLGYKLIEVPTHEAERIGGYSKAGTWDVGWAYTKLFVKELFLGKKFLDKSFDHSSGAYLVVN